MTRQLTFVVLGTLLNPTWTIAENPAGNRPTDKSTTVVPPSFRSVAESGQSLADRGQPRSAVHELLGADRPGGSAAGEHPLMPALRWAKDTLPAIEQIEDYSATLVKREQLNGKIGKQQTLLIKVRQAPFSVYMRALAPAAIKGQEAIYVHGQNDGKLWAHPAGMAGRLVHTLSLKPDGEVAMREQRYPITEIGILNLVRRLIAVAEQDLQHGECDVKYFAGGTINGRACTWFQVVHPEPRRYFRFHIARVFVDDESKIPIRYEAYTWPRERGGDPILLEEYSYLNLRVDNGFTDNDFSIENPAYHFR